MTDPVKTKNLVQIARTDDLKNGTMKEFQVGKREILLARVENKFYAADNICPHMGGKLGQGKLKGTMVTCPRHASMFDLRDGRVIRWTDWTGVKASVSKLIRSPRPILIYQVKIEGNIISVEL